MNRTINRWGSSAAILAAMLVGLAQAGQAQSNWLKKFKDPNKEAVTLKHQGYFYVNGRYFRDAEGVRMTGQMYVEYQIPEHVTHPYPLVLIHGGSQTAANWMGTLDGREGWRSFFTANGYIVYIVDQVGRGRSPAYNPLTPYSAEDNKPAPLVTYGMPFVKPSNVLTREQNWSIPEKYLLWPNAALHTQWPGFGRPGAGEPGDPAFDQFFASQIQSRLDGPGTDTQRDAQDAGAALLDQIGPAIVVTHSQSGTQGFLIADARPNLVKGLVTLEGGGYPYTFLPVGAPNWFVLGPVNSRWGLTSVPITYSPAVTDPSQLSFKEDAAPDPGKLVRCWLQNPAAPGGVRQLINLQKMAHLLVVAEASERANHNHCVSKYLTQAGVRNTWVNLGSIGIHGNSHMIMVEKNALETAAFVATWLQDNVEKKAKRND
jgi:pimeloyl-ACP methyl ester carboxylesterase